MSKYTVIVSGGTLDASFVLPILTGQNGWENLQLEESAVREEKEEIEMCIRDSPGRGAEQVSVSGEAGKSLHYKSGGGNAGTSD